MWNWNYQNDNAKSEHYPFNRTIVELKLTGIGDGWFTENAFNRTIVELKLTKVVRRTAPSIILLIGPLWNWNPASSYILLQVLYLLIGPLWNWNADVIHELVYCPLSFNRTIVELKPRNLRPSFWPPSAFNRTIVELKLLERSMYPAICLSFNRTIVELKHITYLIWKILL